MYTLLDIQEANRDRLGAPDRNEYESFIHLGCRVGLTFVSDEAEPDRRSEDEEVVVWVRVTRVGPGEYTGMVDNQPVPSAGLPDAGAQVTFQGRHVKAVLPPSTGAR